jgi:hypothetical protein
VSRSSLTARTWRVRRRAAARRCRPARRTGRGRSQGCAGAKRCAGTTRPTSSPIRVTTTSSPAATWVEQLREVRLGLVDTNRLSHGLTNYFPRKNARGDPCGEPPAPAAPVFTVAPVCRKLGPPRQCRLFVGSARGAWTARRVLARLVWFPPAATSNRACGSPAHGSPTFFTAGIQRPRRHGRLGRGATMVPPRLISPIRSGD